MTRKRPPEAPKAEPELRMSAAEAAAKIDERIAKAKDFLARAREIRSGVDVQALRDDYYAWDAYNTELLRRMFTTPELADEYSFWGIAVVGAGEESLAEKVRDLTKD